MYLLLYFLLPSDLQNLIYHKLFYMYTYVGTLVYIFRKTQLFG